MTLWQGVTQQPTATLDLEPTLPNAAVYTASRHVYLCRRSAFAVAADGYLSDARKTGDASVPWM
jgi:hypothetical protein